MLKKKLKLFAGPCVLESESLVMNVAETLMNLIKPLEDKVEFYFKGSFDKANRTSINSYRGPGLEVGLDLLQSVKKQFGCKTITDFHYPEQAKQVAQVVDVLQIPAFLCRQTDMIVEGAKQCAQYGRILKIKKGQFLSPWDTKNIVEKAHHFLPYDQILLTERGTSFGYQNLIVDMTSFQVMQEFGVQVIYDATHSLQCPGALGNQTGGKREFFHTLARSALAAGADGLFIETHPQPEKALSDAATSIPLQEFGNYLYDLVRIFEVIHDNQK